MSPRFTGWAFVTAQVALIVALVMLPGRDDWPTPTWLRAVGNGLLIAGFGVIGIASLRLGSSLTPTPVPTCVTTPNRHATNAGCRKTLS